MHYLLLLPLLLILACERPIQPETGKGQFPENNFHKIIAYEYDGSNQGENIIHKGQLNPKVQAEKTLSPQETQNLIQILNQIESYGGDQARCFRPQLGLVFYNENNQIIEHLSICFECNNFAASTKIKASLQAPSLGFSNQGRKQLMAFCQNLGFKHCQNNQ